MLRVAPEDPSAAVRVPKPAHRRHAVAWQVRRLSSGLSVATIISILAAGVALPSQSPLPRKFEARVGDLAAISPPNTTIQIVAVRSIASALTGGDLALRPVVRVVQPPTEATVPSATASSSAAPTEVTVSLETQAAREECARVLSSLTIEWEAVPALQEGACGTPAPIRVRRIGAIGVELSPPAIMNCQLAAALHKWTQSTLQPSAKELLAAHVLRLSGVQSYSCRNRNNAKAGPVSEHAFANAIDITALHMSDGRSFTVARDWGPVARDAGKPATGGATNSETIVTKASVTAVTTTANTLPSPAQFLRRIHAGACTTFGTVLGPEANEAHRDHLHFDLKARTRKTMCE